MSGVPQYVGNNLPGSRRRGRAVNSEDLTRHAELRHASPPCLSCLWGLLAAQVTAREPETPRCGGWFLSGPRTMHARCTCNVTPGCVAGTSAQRQDCTSRCDSSSRTYVCSFSAWQRMHAWGTPVRLCRRTSLAPQWMQLVRGSRTCSGNKTSGSQTIKWFTQPQMMPRKLYCADVRRDGTCQHTGRHTGPDAGRPYFCCALQS